MTEADGRNIYECANQLMGYVGPDTEDHLAQFLMRQGKAATALADALSQAHSTIAALRVERDKAIRSRDHTVQWYAERLRKIEDVAKRGGLWPEVAAIIANGSGTRQLQDGSFVYDPPTYAQQLNSAKHRAETAEAEVKRLTEEKEALRVEVDRCHARLEIDHVFVAEGDDFVRREAPMDERLSLPDAVECRDATISILEADARKAMESGE